MDAKQIAKLINDVKDGVDKSTFGPMFVYPDPHDFRKRDVNQLAMIVFSSVLPMVISIEGQKEIANAKKDQGLDQAPQS